MGSEINFLILDEPTNHLDITSREWMEDALSDYEQTLLFVSHDRYFIEKFAERIWELADGEFIDYRGGYRDFVAWKQRQAALRAPAVKKEPEVRKQPARARTPNTDRLLARTEREIARLEGKIAELDALAAEHGSDYQKLMEIGAQKEELDARLLELYESWEELSS